MSVPGTCIVMYTSIAMQIVYTLLQHDSLAQAQVSTMSYIVTRLKKGYVFLGLLKAVQYTFLSKYGRYSLCSCLCSKVSFVSILQPATIVVIHMNNNVVEAHSPRRAGWKKWFWTNGTTETIRFDCRMFCPRKLSSATYTMYTAVNYIITIYRSHWPKCKWKPVQCMCVSTPCLSTYVQHTVKLYVNV